MQKNRPNPIWKFFSSVRLTIILLIILAVTSIFGTVIPQQETAMDFIQRLNPGLVNLLNSLQLFDMYHSVWFRLFTFLLAINLIICSMNRFPATWKLFQYIPRADRSKPFEKLPPNRSFTLHGSLKDAGTQVIKIIKVRYQNIRIKELHGTTFIYGEAGKYSVFGVYLVHLSVLLILTGAIIGSLFGFKAYVNILEGESVDSVVLRKSFRHEHQKLPFRVHCEKFSVDFYDNGTPKEFRSDLSFMINGDHVQKGNLFVNHPVSFKGITFYQASYGVLSGNRAQLRISKNGMDSDNPTMEVEIGKAISLPDGSGQYILSEIRDDFMRLGTAALITIQPVEGKEMKFWIFKDYERLKKILPDIFEKYPKFNPSSYSPYTFYLTDVESRYYTGLQVNKDPGVSLVYAGFVVIMIGLFITFFMSYRRVWIRVTERDGAVDVSVAGKSNKNPVGMERELDQLLHKLEIHLAPEREI